MTKEIRLLAGQRIRLDDENVFTSVISGKVEVYAVTSGDASFRQCFLTELVPGETAFPAMDSDFEEVATQLYATEDSVIIHVPFDESTTEDLRTRMKSWFAKLTTIPWLGIIADKGDEVILSWRERTVLTKGATKDELVEDFRSNEQILAMFIGVRFGAEDKRLARRVKIRENSKHLLVENGIRSLLGENKLLISAKEVSNDKKNVTETIFIVKAVADALSMPKDNIHIAEETTNNLDAVALIRRLMQKS